MVPIPPTASYKRNGAQYPQLDYADSARLPAAWEEHRRLVRDFTWALGKISRRQPGHSVGRCTRARLRHIGRGQRSRTSVVDADGKVHGLDNLYVVDGSVLPFLQLGQPLADHLCLGVAGGGTAATRGAVSMNDTPAGLYPFRAGGCGDLGQAERRVSGGWATVWAPTPPA